MDTDPATAHATQLRNHWWWRPGWRAGRQFYTWHLTFEDQHDLHRLVETYQNELRNLPELDLIPPRWLHLTMQGIGFADDLPAGTAHAMVEAARERLAELAPAELAFHRAVVRPEAITLPPTPMEALFAIRNAIRDGVAAVWGKDRIPETSNRFDPHVSMAYANADTSSAAALAAITNVQPESVGVTVSAASLIVLQRDGHLYRWETVARAPFVGRHT